MIHNTITLLFSKSFFTTLFSFVFVQKYHLAYVKENFQEILIPDNNFLYFFFIAANFLEHLPFLSYIYLYRDEIHLSKIYLSDQESLDSDKTICSTGFHFCDH